MEILAPAGSREALERAQAAGADAVYLGFSAFSARAGAGNFGEEELRDSGAERIARTPREIIGILCPEAKPERGAFLTVEGNTVTNLHSGEK